MQYSTVRAAVLALSIAFIALSPLHADSRVNINTADAETLASSLTGVGSTRAQAIVEDREAHGPFESVDDMTRVSGVGAATVDANRERISLD